jgi:radical SAM PhpK family P-methyltransferase
MSVMITDARPDCVIIGYYEPPFETYERLVRNYGTDSEAYRDLKLSFIELPDRKANYIDLLNYVYDAAHPRDSATSTEPAVAGTVFKSGDIPNLAAVYLTNFLRRKGFDAHYVNLFLYEQDRLIDFLRRDPHCIAITTTFYVLNFPVMEVVKFIRRHNSKVPILVGGPLISNHMRNHQRSLSAATQPPGQTQDGLTSNSVLASALEEIGADVYVIESQGESTLCRIVEAFKNGGGLKDIPNIAYFESGNLRINRAEPENNSLDESFISWDEFSGENLGSTVQTRTARSCAFSCSFCNYPTRAGKLTLAQPSAVERELNSLRDLGTVSNVVFIDDTFNVPLARFKDLCRLMIKNKYEFNWFSYFRCSNSDEEAIELMAESGCRGVFLGIESGSPTILRNMNKAATIEKYVEGIKLLRSYGILTFASFITGFPGETEATLKETIDFIEHTKPDYYRSQLWYCEPGAPIENYRDKYKINGHGFVWNHLTMESLEAMDHIDRMFLTIQGSVWLPQWSFDFWIIPYLLGKGIGLENFRDFMISADRLLALDIAEVRGDEKIRLQKKHLSALYEMMKDWHVRY